MIASGQADWSEGGGGGLVFPRDDGPGLRVLSKTDARLSEDVNVELRSPDLGCENRRKVSRGEEREDREG